MVIATAKVQTGVGLHARPVAALVQQAGKARCRVTIEYSGKTIDARSILQVLALGGRDGETIRIVADVPGEEAALAALIGSLRGEGAVAECLKIE